MKNIFTRVVLKITPHIYNRFYRRENHQEHITLLSQNCVGGVLYHMLGLPFDSPTINMFIENENFVKMAENPQHYFSVDAEPDEECHIDRKDASLVYPTIKVDDIVLCCQHYKNCADAVAAWNKRRLRVDVHNLFVIACSWNLDENTDFVKRIDALPYPKVIFTMDDFDFPSCVRLKGAKWQKNSYGVVKPTLTGYDGLSGKRHFVDEFDFVKWINAERRSLS